VELGSQGPLGRTAPLKRTTDENLAKRGGIYAWPSLAKLGVYVLNSSWIPVAKPLHLLGLVTSHHVAFRHLTLSPDTCSAQPPPAPIDLSPWLVVSSLLRTALPPTRRVGQVRPIASPWWSRTERRRLIGVTELPVPWELASLVECYRGSPICKHGVHGHPAALGNVITRVRFAMPPTSYSAICRNSNSPTAPSRHLLKSLGSPVGGTGPGGMGSTPIGIALRPGSGVRV
jgi:hypothetical protein